MAESTSIELKPEERTECEVWSRVMGYHRPVSAYNKGKRQEHRDRRFFREGARGVMRRDWGQKSRNIPADVPARVYFGYKCLILLMEAA